MKLSKNIVAGLAVVVLSTSLIAAASNLASRVDDAKRLTAEANMLLALAKHDKQHGTNTFSIAREHLLTPELAVERVKSQQREVWSAIALSILASLLSVAVLSQLSARQSKPGAL